MSGREPTSAAFEPTVLAPRGRRPDRAWILGAILLGALGVAVAKPWEAGTERPDPAIVLSPLPTGALADHAPPTPSTAVLVQDATMATPITWVRAASAVRPHDRWGVRVVVPTTPTANLDDQSLAVVERWVAATDAMWRDGEEPRDPLILGSEQRVLALAVTNPPNDLLMYVQVWRAVAADTWVALEPMPLEPRPMTGVFLLGPPVVDSVQPPAWSTGLYRLELRTTTGIQYLDLALPGRWERVPVP